MPRSSLNARLPGGRVVAGGSRRFAGWLIDAILATVLAAAIHVGGFRGRPALTVLFVTTATYEVVAVATWGRTIGKLICGTSVVGIDTGSKPTWGAAVLRWLVPASTAVFGYLSSLGRMLESASFLVVYLGVLVHPLRRGLHDFTARTVVVLQRGDRR